MMCETLAAVSLIAATITASPCGQCHRVQASRFSETGMANALVTGAQSEILKSHPKLSFRQGPLSYLIERRGNQSWYTVADGKKEISLPVEWAFGLGAAGQTYVLRLNNSWIESRVSYYREIDALDLTVGAHPEVPDTLEEALGRTLSKRRVNECFDCHATAALQDGILHTELLTPGIQCQRCHDGADAHLATFQHSSAAKVVPRQLSQMTTEEMSEFCGQCHRTWVQIASEGPHDINNVRFQPYRLTNSKCYDPTNAKIQCTACHNPHTEVVHGASAYDSHCLGCHSAKTSAKVCTAASANCVSCHMAKVRLPEAHIAFTDHWIRIFKPGQPYPR
jgi:hypothetical protein